MTQDKEIDECNENEIMCPYCKTEFIDSWENKDLRQDGDNIIEDCPQCKKKFHVSLSIRWSYHSRGLCSENNVDHNWESFDHTSEKYGRCKGRKCLVCDTYQLEGESK
jgi:uncharacterized Zn-finger protein